MESARPIGLIYCVNTEQLESAVECGWIPDCTDVESLTDKSLRSYLESESQETSETLTEAELTKMVESDLKMDMSVKSAKSRMKLLFMSYKSMLRTNGLKWVTEDTPKVAVKHVLMAIRPAQLRNRLENDIKFAKAKLKSDFKGFMKHAIELSDCFEKLDNGPPKARKTNKEGEKTAKDNGNSHQTDSSSSKARTKIDSKSKKQKTLPPTPCPLPSCRGKNRFHWMADCTESTDTQKEQYREELAAAKARDGPSKSTRSQKTEAGSRTVSRLKQEPISAEQEEDKPSCQMTV